MRFGRSDNSPPPYFNKRDQRRMLLMVGLLMLVVFAMKWAGRPETWHWLVPPDEQPQEHVDSADAPPAFVPQTHAERQPLKPGEFRTPLAENERPENGSAPAPEGKTNALNEETETQAAAADADPKESSLRTTGVDPSLLKDIRDNDIGIRSDEAEAFYALLARARDASIEELQRSALQNVVYTVVCADPEAFRGQLLTMEGRVKRLLPFSAGENSHGLETLYDLWMFTPDSGTKPIRIVCTSVPESLPQSKEISGDVNVQVTGYFFKLEGYHAPSGVQIAPVLLAQSPTLFAPEVAPVREMPTRYIAAGVIAALVGLVLMLWRLNRGDVRFYRKHVKRVTTAPPEAIDALQDVETSDPTDWIRRMTDEETKAESNRD